MQSYLEALEMSRLPSSMLAVGFVTAGALLLGGAALADTVYPPTPPAGTEVPTESPEPVEVAPAATERPAPAPAVQVEAEQLAVTGTDVAVLAAIAAGLVAAGLALMRSTRRRRGADDMGTR